MPKDPKPSPPSNVDTEETRVAVAEHTHRIRALKRNRADINASINSERKAIRALGVDLDAWRASERRWEMDPDERDEFDRSHEICNRALGVPANAYQAELFEEDDEEAVAARNAAVKGGPDGGDLPDGPTGTVQ